MSGSGNGQPAAGSLRAYVSLWSADLLAVGDAVDRIAPGADGLHVDVFDGSAGSDLLFGPDFVAALRDHTDALIDVHLLVADPDRWARRFAAAGADMITVHLGAGADPRATLATVRKLGTRVGVAVCCDEPIESVTPHLAAVDRVLVMGTAIGVKGVDLDPATPDRIRALVAARADCGSPRTEIVVDGGIRRHTVRTIAAAGADGVVPGSLVFDDPNPVEALAWIRSAGAERFG